VRFKDHGSVEWSTFAAIETKVEVCAMRSGQCERMIQRDGCVEVAKQFPQARLFFRLPHHFHTLPYF
jgi:hypothetical protein